MPGQINKETQTNPTSSQQEQVSKENEERENKQGSKASEQKPSGEQKSIRDTKSDKPQPDKE